MTTEFHLHEHLLFVESRHTLIKFHPCLSLVRNDVGQKTNKLAEERKDLARKYAPKLDAPDSLEEEDECEEEWPTQQSEDMPVVGIGEILPL
jgi:hypothetical protein